MRLFKLISLLLVAVWLIIAASIANADAQDPTRPADFINNNQPSVNIANLQVSSILISRNRRIAVINGQFFKVGDSISGNKVVKIDANSVALDGPQGRITLFLADTSIKTPR